MCIADLLRCLQEMLLRIYSVDVVIGFVFLVSETLSSCPKCTYYEIDHTPGEYTLENKRLNGCNFTSLFVPGLGSCFLSCIYDFCQCASINFKTSPEANGTFFCELNYETSTSANASFMESKDNSLFLDIVTYNSTKVSHDIRRECI